MLSLTHTHTHASWASEPVHALRVRHPGLNAGAVRLPPQPTASSAAGQPPSVTLGAEAAPDACRTSASGGTALRRFPSPAPKAAHRSPWVRPHSLPSGSSPSVTHTRNFPAQACGPSRPHPQVQVKVERSVETNVVENKGSWGGAHLQGKTAGHCPQGSSGPGKLLTGPVLTGRSSG